MTLTSQLADRRIPSRDVRLGMHLPSFAGPQMVTRVDVRAASVTVTTPAGSREYAPDQRVWVLVEPEGAGGTLSALDVEALVKAGFTGAGVVSGCGQWATGGSWASAEHDADIQAWVFRAVAGGDQAFHFIVTERTTKRKWKLVTANLSAHHAVAALLQQLRWQVRVIELGTMED